MMGPVSRPSLAIECFTQIKEAHDQFAFLASLVKSTPPTFETDWRDFKVGDDPAIKDKKKLEGDQKKVWSKALSAMANSGGGVLIWGINAAKDGATGIDAANDLALVPDVHQFLTRLQEFHRQATDPPVLNVEYVPVTKSPTDPSGFVVCFIPESSFKPHRAEYVDGKPFFLRAGDNSAPASVALLRYLFHPAVNSLINLEVGVSVQGSDPKEQVTDDNGEIVVSLHGVVQNIGTSTAKDLLLTLVVVPPSTQLQAMTHWEQSSCFEGYALEHNRPLHPGAIAPAFTLEIRTKVMKLSAVALLGPTLPAIKLMFGVYATDREPQHGFIDFLPQDILAQRNKRSAGDLGYRYQLPDLWQHFRSELRMDK
jgi:hypothetical protein